MKEYEAVVKRLGERGVKVLAFIPPMATDTKSDWDSEDMTVRQAYKAMVDHMQGIAERNPNFVFKDIHNFGDNGYALEEFNDNDHLNVVGATKLTRKLEQIRKEFGE